MVYFDHEVRSQRSTGLRSRTLGPLIESYFNAEDYDSDGYPSSITEGLGKYTIVRLM